MYLDIGKVVDYTLVCATTETLKARGASSRRRPISPRESIRQELVDRACAPLVWRRSIYRCDYGSKGTKDGRGERWRAQHYDRELERGK